MSILSRRGELFGDSGRTLHEFSLAPAGGSGGSGNSGKPGPARRRALRPRRTAAPVVQAPSPDASEPRPRRPTPQGGLAIAEFQVDPAHMSRHQPDDGPQGGQMAFHRLADEGPRGIMSLRAVVCPPEVWARRPESRDPNWASVMVDGSVLAIRTTWVEVPPAPACPNCHA